MRKIRLLFYIVIFYWDITLSRPRKRYSGIVLCLNSAVAGLAESYRDTFLASRQVYIMRLFLSHTFAA